MDASLALYSPADLVESGRALFTPLFTPSIAIRDPTPLSLLSFTPSFGISNFEFGIFARARPWQRQRCRDSIDNRLYFRRKTPNYPTTYIHYPLSIIHLDFGPRVRPRFRSTYCRYCTPFCAWEKMSARGQGAPCIGSRVRLSIEIRLHMAGPGAADLCCIDGILAVLAVRDAFCASIESILLNAHVLFFSFFVPLAVCSFSVLVSNSTQRSAAQRSGCVRKGADVIICK